MEIWGPLVKRSRVSKNPQTTVIVFFDTPIALIQAAG